MSTRPPTRRVIAELKLRKWRLTETEFDRLVADGCLPEREAPDAATPVRLKRTGPDELALRVHPQHPDLCPRGRARYRAARWDAVTQLTVVVGLLAGFGWLTGSGTPRLWDTVGFLAIDAMAYLSHRTYVRYRRERGMEERVLREESPRITADLPRPFAEPAANRTPPESPP
jgi:hypothetical protein